MNASHSMISVNKTASVIPGHHELFGQKGTLPELIAIIKRYPLFEWMSYLSRLQNMFWGTRALHREWIRAAFDGVLSLDLKQRISKFEENRNLQGNLGLFYERQISTLQQLVLLYASESSDRTFNSESDRHNLGLALLITLDVMNANRPEDARNARACLLQDHIRTVFVSAERCATRAFDFYRLLNPSPNSELEKYLSLYHIATGANAIDAITGGVIQFSIEIDKEPGDLAQAWRSVVPPLICEEPELRRVMDAFAAVRWASPSVMKLEIMRCEKERCPGDWNLIALSKYPIIDFGVRGAFVLNHSALGKGLFSGVRHAVLTAANSGRLPAPYKDGASVGHLYGNIFQKYALRILKEAAPDRTYEIPDENKRRCDILVWFPDRVVLFEVKAQHFVASTHAEFMTLEQRRAELEEVGIATAVDQLVKTIHELRSGQLIVPGMPEFDWTIVPIVPVVITEEVLSRFPLVWNDLYAPFGFPLDSLRGAGPVGTLRIMPIDELETLPDISGSDDWGSLIYRWGEASDTRELAWGTFLDSVGAKVGQSYSGSRLMALAEFVDAHLAGRLRELE